ncbi:MAG: amidohydrolase family protein [Acidimicrobiales bacterium]
MDPAGGSGRTIPSWVRAIDAHVHLSDETWAATMGDERARSIARAFGRTQVVVPVDEMAAEYRERSMMAVIVNSTDATVTGRASVPNEHIAEVVAAHPDVFLGLGVVDPWQGKLAEEEICRIAELGLVGVGELNPARQHFAPNDERFAPLWRCADELGLVVLFHGGYAAAGSNTPGGGGVKLRFARPTLLDDVAADFPTLRLICAHPSWPWEAEALAVAMHKRNVYLDLSGVAPKYLSAEVRQYVRRRIPEKVLFGTDWPSLSVDRWLEEFSALELDDDVRHKVLLQNAMRLFGLRHRDAVPPGPEVGR